MAGGKGAHSSRGFLTRLRMCRALGIHPRRRMRPARRFRGRERRHGTWWDREQNCIAIEGQDFAQDTQEGGGDQFEFIPDSDEERGKKDSSLIGCDEEFVPETEPQENIAVSSIVGPCANQGRKRLGTMLHEWRQMIWEQEKECANSIAIIEEKERQLKDIAREDMHQQNNGNQQAIGKGEMKHKDSGNEDPVDHKSSISDLSTDEDASWVQDGVDLRGYSQVEDDDFED